MKGSEESGRDFQLAGCRRYEAGSKGVCEDEVGDRDEVEDGGVVVGEDERTGNWCWFLGEGEEYVEEEECGKGGAGAELVGKLGQR